jgi:hypothetical protein
MSPSIYGLKKLISEIDENELSFKLSSFKCSAEPAAEEFLRNTAVRHEKNGISRTYLLMEKDNTGEEIIKGFFTLAIKCFTTSKEHSIPDAVFKQMNVDRGIAQAYLLGQLAKADDMEKGFGRERIVRAFDAFSKGKEMFGCRVVRLDCKDGLLEYYESCGFTFAGKNHNGTLNQMVAII